MLITGKEINKRSIPSVLSISKLFAGYYLIVFYQRHSIAALYHHHQSQLNF
jgi:hypothetical protein